MSPQSPNKAIDAFKSSVEDHTSRFEETTRLIKDSGGGVTFTELQLRRGLAVDYFFRVATDWQVFQDDWSVRAIAHKPSGLLDTFSKRFERELRESAASKTLELFPEVRLAVPSLGRSLTSVQVRRILDSSGRNLDFASSAQWKTWAVKHLADPHKDVLVRQLTDDETTSLLDLVRQLRNFVAHRSDSSLTQIQSHTARRSSETRVGLVGPANERLIVERVNQVRDVGTYLDRALGSPYGTPALYIEQRLRDIAESLRWSA